MSGKGSPIHVKPARITSHRYAFLPIAAGYLVKTCNQLALQEVPIHIRKNCRQEVGTTLFLDLNLGISLELLMRPC